MFVWNISGQFVFSYSTAERWTETDPRLSQQGEAGHRKQSSLIYYHTYIHIYIFHVYTQIVFSLGSIKKIDQPSIYKKYLLYMIEKSLLQVYTDLHPRLSPKYTIRGNVLSLSVEGGPCRRWRDAGQHTCLHAHTHAYTSHTRSHTAVASLWRVLAHLGVLGGSWLVLGLRWAAGPASLWGDTAAPGSAGAGQW